MRFSRPRSHALCPSASRASTEIHATASEAEKALAEAVATSPIALTDLFKRTQSQHHRVLRARFALDADGELVGQVLLRVTSKDQVSFDEWAGRVYSGGWVPRQRVLTDQSELTEAERLWALRPGSIVLWQAVHNAGESKAADQSDGIVLSAVASSSEGRESVDLLVGRDGGTHGLVFVLNEGGRLKVDFDEHPPSSGRCPLEPLWLSPPLVKSVACAQRSL